MKNVHLAWPVRLNDLAALLSRLAQGLDEAPRVTAYAM